MFARNPVSNFLPMRATTFRHFVPFMNLNTESHNIASKCQREKGENLNSTVESVTVDELLKPICG